MPRKTLKFKLPEVLLSDEPTTNFKTKQQKTDNADLFAHYWRNHAPPHAPSLVREFHFAKERKRNYRADFAEERSKVLIEIDGGNRLVRYTTNKRGHRVPVVVGRHTGDDDYEKLNLANELGWVVLRYTPRMINRDPMGCIEQVLRTIQARTRR